MSSLSDIRVRVIADTDAFRNSIRLATTALEGLQRAAVKGISGQGASSAFTQTANAIRSMNTAVDASVKGVNKMSDAFKTSSNATSSAGKLFTNSTNVLNSAVKRFETESVKSLNNVGVSATKALSADYGGQFSKNATRLNTAVKGIESEFKRSMGTAFASANKAFSTDYGSMFNKSGGKLNSAVRGIETNYTKSLNAVSATAHKAFATDYGSMFNKSAGKLQTAITGINKVQNDSNRITRSLDASFIDLTKSILKSAPAFAVATAAISAVYGTIRALRDEFIRGLKAVEDYNLKVATTSAYITSFSSKAAKGDIAGAFAEAVPYAKQLVSTLEIMDAKTIASGKDLQNMAETFMQHGVLIDINNEKQIRGFTNLATAIKSVTAGQNQEIQMRQEINALMTGTARVGDKITKFLLAQDPLLKEHLVTWKKEGTVIENIEKMLGGFNAASTLFETTWEAIGSTLSTIHDRVLRGGFRPIYEDLLSIAIKIKDHFMDASGNLTVAGFGIQLSIIDSWEDFRTVVVSIQAEFIRLTALLDNLGRSSSLSIMALYGPAAALGHDKSQARFDQFAQYAIDYENRYAENDRKLQALADWTVKAEANSTLRKAEIIKMMNDAASGKVAPKLNVPELEIKDPGFSGVDVTDKNTAKGYFSRLVEAGDIDILKRQTDWSNEQWEKNVKLMEENVDGLDLIDDANREMTMSIVDAKIPLTDYQKALQTLAEQETDTEWAIRNFSLTTKSMVAGSKMGLNQLITDWQGWGNATQNIVIGVGGSIRTALSESLFSAITGDFENFADIWDNLWRSMVMTVASAVSEMAIAWGAAKVLSWFHTGNYNVGKDQLAVLEAGEMVLDKGTANLFRKTFESSYKSVTGENAPTVAIRDELLTTWQNMSGTRLTGMAPSGMGGFYAGMTGAQAAEAYGILSNALGPTFYNAAGSELMFLAATQASMAPTLGASAALYSNAAAGAYTTAYSGAIASGATAAEASAAAAAAQASTAASVSAGTTSAAGGTAAAGASTMPAWLSAGGQIAAAAAAGWFVGTTIGTWIFGGKSDPWFSGSFIAGEVDPPFFSAEATGTGRNLEYNQVLGLTNAHQDQYKRASVQLGRMEEILNIQLPAWDLSGTSFTGFNPYDSYEKVIAHYAEYLGAESAAGGFKYGGISYGPDSGHLEMLHGTEAVVPLDGGGTIPVKIDGSGGEQHIHLHVDGRELAYIIASQYRKGNSDLRNAFNI